MSTGDVDGSSVVGWLYIEPKLPGGDIRRATEETMAAAAAIGPIVNILFLFPGLFLGCWAKKTFSSSAASILAASIFRRLILQGHLILLWCECER